MRKCNSVTINDRLNLFLEVSCPLLWIPVLHVFTNHIGAHMQLFYGIRWLPNLVTWVYIAVKVKVKLTSKLSDLLREVTVRFTEARAPVIVSMFDQSF